jgi:nicotinamide-nucleotide amidase
MADDAPVAERLGERLRERGETLAVAESCTGGLLGSTITNVPGASDYFVGGVISYMNRTKLAFLAVSREALDRHGAVSRPVAREMAQHVRDEAGADWALSTTGFAGAAPESSDEPAGTVYVGVACAGDRAAEEAFSVVERHQFDGTRHEVKAQIVERALESLLAQVRSTE